MDISMDISVDISMDTSMACGVVCWAARAVCRDRFPSVFSLGPRIDLGLQLAPANAAPPNAPRPDPAIFSVFNPFSIRFQTVFIGLLISRLNWACQVARARHPIPDRVYSVFWTVFWTHFHGPLFFRVLDLKMETKWKS